jgi:hypothetical protein
MAAVCQQNLIQLGFISQLHLMFLTIVSRLVDVDAPIDFLATFSE